MSPAGRGRDLYEIYLELYPAKVMVEADELDEILAETKTFITFLAQTELLDEESESPDVLCDFLGEIAPEFRKQIATRPDTASASGSGPKRPAKACRRRPGGSRGVHGPLQHRPRAERDAILGQASCPPGAGLPLAGSRLGEHRPGRQTSAASVGTEQPGSGRR